MASPRKFLLLAKIEVTQFTDPVPTAAANAMLVKELQVTPLRVETEDRALIRPYFGISDQIPVLNEGTLSFKVEMAGAGAAGTAPKYGPLLRACGLSETISAGVSVIYQPVSGSFESATIYAYRDGVLYKFLGAMGSVRVEMSAKKIPHYVFTFTGQYSAVTDAAVPSTPDFSGFQQPRASIPTYTGACTIGGYAAKLAAFDADLGNQVSHAIWMNNETLQITDRQSKGDITVEQVTVATNDYFAKLLGANLQAVSILHGTTAGNKVQLDFPKAQQTDFSETTFENVLAWKWSLVFAPNAGNDEFKITVT